MDALGKIWNCKFCCCHEVQGFPCHPCFIVKLGQSEDVHALTHHTQEARAGSTSEYLERLRELNAAFPLKLFLGSEAGVSQE